MRIGRRVNGSSIDQEVRDALDHLQQGTLTANPLEPIAKYSSTIMNSPHTHYLGHSTTFARMWIGAQEILPLKVETDSGEFDGQPVYTNSKGVKYYYPDPPEYNDAGKKKAAILTQEQISQITFPLPSPPRVYMIGDNQKPDYIQRESMVDVYSPNFGEVDNTYLKPKPGITSITTQTDGSVSALSTTTINFVVHNHREMEEIIEPWFFQPGTTVVVDFGWSHMGSSFDNSELYDPLSVISRAQGNSLRFKEFIFGRGFKEEADYKTGLMRDSNWRGRLYVAIGNVISYNAKMNQFNSYECSIELTSVNTALVSRTLRRDTPNGPAPAFIFSNAMDDILATAFSIKGLGADEISNEVTDKQLANPKDPKVAKKAVLDFFKGVHQGVRMSSAGQKEFGIEPDPQTGKISVEKSMGEITNIGLTTGILYNEVPKEQGDYDSLYISYGLFEDAFLNVLMTATIDTSENDFNIIFNSRDSYVRYHDSFVELQTTSLEGSEIPNIFMIPSSWAGSYNSKEVGKNDLQAQHEKDGTFSYDNFIDGEYSVNEEPVQPPKPLFGVPVIPLREIFIDVYFIQKTFASAQSITDALQTIWDRVSNESGDIWNINISTPRDGSQSQISFDDVNLTPSNATNPVYELDVTSHDSIVIDNDLTFQIPKGKIAQLVAMRNQQNPMETKTKDMARLLEFLQLSPNSDGESKRYWLTLPYIGAANNRAEDKQGDPSNLIGRVSDKIKTHINNQPGDPELLKNSLAEATNDYVDTTTNRNFIGPMPPDEDTKSENTNKVKKIESGEPNNVTYVDTRREAIMEDLRKALVDGSNPRQCVRKYLPVELNLTIHGNTFLDVLDLITINNLPDFLKKRICFKIMGVSHNLTNNSWSTTYTCLMQQLPDTHTANVTRFTTEPKEEPEPEVLFSEEKTIEEMSDAPEDPPEGGKLNDVVANSVEVSPAKRLANVIVFSGGPATFEYEVLSMGVVLSEQQTQGNNKKTNYLAIGDISILQDLAMGYALRDHMLDSSFSNQSVVVEAYEDFNDTPIQLEILNQIPLINSMRQFIESQNSTMVDDFLQRVNQISHPSEFIYDYNPDDVLSLQPGALLSEVLAIPTVPNSISFTLSAGTDTVYKVTQIRGAPDILPEFHIPGNALAEGVGIREYLLELIRKYHEYYTLLTTLRTPDEILDNKEPQVDAAEEQTSDDLNEENLDNNALLWEEPYFYDDIIYVDMDGAEDKAIYHYYISLALDKIKFGAPDEFKNIILPFTDTIKNVKSDEKLKNSDVSFARGTNFFLKERPQFTNYKAWNIDSSLHIASYDYNKILYNLIHVILHECYHCYQAANKTKIFGQIWSEPTCDWETPAIEFEALTLEKIMKADAGNLNRSDLRMVETQVLQSLATVKENRYQATLDPPGKLNHADVDGDGDYDADDSAIMALQNAAGRASQSITGLTDAQLSEIYGDEVTRSKSRFRKSKFADYFRKMKFHFDTKIEEKDRKRRIARTEREMSDAEFNARYLKRLKRPGGGSQVGVPQD